MFLYLVSLVHKIPDKMMLHIGTYHSPFYSTTETVKETRKLKKYILEQFYIVKLVISTSKLRIDKANANLTTVEVTKHLQTNEENIIIHPNIKGDTTCSAYK